MQLQGMDTLEPTTPTTSCFTTETRSVRDLQQQDQQQDGLRCDVTRSVSFVIKKGGGREKVEVEKGKSEGSEDKMLNIHMS